MLIAILREALGGINEMGKLEERIKREIEKSREELNEMNERIRDRIWGGLDKFPGSLVEYSNFKGCEYEFMDTGVSDKFVRWSDKELLIKLAQMGCEGLVRYTKYHIPHIGDNPYGIPVKKRFV